MKQYRIHIIAGFIVAAVLILAFFAGGDTKVFHSNKITQTGALQTEQAATQPKMPETKAVTPEQNVNANADTAQKAQQGALDVQDTKPTSANVKLKTEGEAVPNGDAPKNVPDVSDTSDTSDTPQKQYTCTLSVRCDTAILNKEKLSPGKAEILPPDGIIYAENTVVFYAGESVFNVLKREMKKNKIHMEFVNTPVYHSAYIEGIGNLYEFDCGELSGWMYKVNVVFPNYGCSRYTLQD